MVAGLNGLIDRYSTSRCVSKDLYIGERDMAAEVDRYRPADLLPLGAAPAADQVDQCTNIQGLHRQDWIASFADEALATSQCTLLACRGLQQLDSSTSDRFLKLQDTALEQCQDTDDSDLRRLKKHFKTLKNTFTVYDLKEGFIEGKSSAGSFGKVCLTPFAYASI